MCGLASAASDVVHAAFWVFVVLGGLWLLRRGPARRRARRPDPVSRSLGLLNERYARGLIDRDEYLERRAFLE